MSDLSGLPEILFWGVLLTSWWPGLTNAAYLEKPKKGYWTIDTVFWPLRKAYQDLWPEYAVLEKAARRSHAAAAYIAVSIWLLTHFVPPFVHAFGPGWIMTETALITFLLGRTTGFWSADRRLRKVRQADEAAEAKA